MKDRIIEALKSVHRALNYEEIDSLLNIKTIEETKEMNEALEELENSGEIYHSNKNKYMLFTDSNLRKGVLRVNKKGFGFVEVLNEEDIFIPIDNINGALDKDDVAVEIIETKSDGRREGRIVRVLKRNVSTVVGEIYFKKEIGHIIPDDKKLKLDIEIPKGKNLGSVDGHKVVVEIESINKNKCLGKVIKILGHKNDPGVDIISVVEKYEIKYEFDQEVIEELDTIPEEICELDKQGRKDLTDQMIFTIDGDDTKDIDDAISVEKLPNGNYKLGVHIADVSYYVKEGNPLDNEAMERGTSVYLVDRVIPMIPHKLSNGICSLNPEVERLAISCVMEIDNKGQTVDYEIFESVIKSRIQMTYKKANKVLTKEETPEGYEPYVDTLLLMKELADIIRKAKLERGYIDFDTDEAKVLVDENGVPTDVVLRDKGPGQELIEDFMIQANECVATHIFYMELPFIYRVHEYPKEDKINSFLSFVNSLGYQIPKDIRDMSPKSMQKLLYFLKDKKEYKVLSSLLLRDMQKAIYLPQNLGHYGLASKCYTHFTSPIRRYPDTTVHRLLRTYLFNKDLDNKTIKHWEEKLIYVADHSSVKERSSVDCEREVDDMKMAEYMEQHIGETFKGMISSITSFGFFVELDNLIEGLVRITDLNGFYDYNEENQMLVDEKTHNSYKLGDQVVVKVVRASKEEREIDFTIVRKL
jgi:ribonuclease R